VTDEEKQTRAQAADEAWRPLAEGTRAALANLGYVITPLCLPGEPEACGGSWAQHAAAHLAVLQAVTAHHFDHLGGVPDWARAITLTACQDLGCSMGQAPAPDPAGAGPLPG
jgi:hypothetical protein